jgi:hypothetical protein
VQARKRPGEMPISRAQTWTEDRVWPRGSRIVFVVAAALGCWAIPLLLVYLFTS